MESFLEKLNKLKVEILLGEERKQIIRNRLISRIELGETVRGRATDRHGMQRSVLSSNFLFKPMPVFAVIAIFALVGGGATFAAEHSLPGDVLYPVKVHVNEEVKAFVQISPQAKAEWEAKRAERRLEEAIQLALQGKMSAKTSVEIENRFAEQAGNVEERIHQINSKGDTTVAADVAAHFETKLRAHGKVLQEIEAEKPETEKGLQPLDAKIRSAIEVIGGVRSGLETGIAAPSEGDTAVKEEARISLKASAEAKISAATDAISSVRSFVEQKKESLGAEATVKAAAKLTRAEELVVAAKAKFDAGLYGAAFNLGNRAISVAEAAKLLVEARTDLKVMINIDNNHDEEGGGNEEIKNSSSTGTSGETRVEGGVSGSVSSSGSGVESSGEMKLRLNF